ncbi:hypothetical protein [Streptomyces sp. NPDC046862]|uniref:hypothetical protein n=1 Tax=Streptomyces sp. NPDC046862 TaxID=3154603 RepID=UPI003456AD8A
MRRAAPLLLVLASVLALAGCGQQAESSASQARPTSSDDPRYLPLAAYDMSGDDGRTVNRASWTLARQCMVRLGFDSLRNLSTDPAPDWPQRPAGTAVAMLIAYSDDLRYGIRDPEQAARYGYQGARADYERDHPERKWTLSEYLALTGMFVGDDPRTVHGHRIPERGCLGEADREIYGWNPQDRIDPVWHLKSKSLQQAMRDPAWGKADKAWSACMRKAGYRYANPADAVTGSDRKRQELRERLADPEYDLNKPSALEKKTATADARCKQRTGYVRTVHAIDVRIQLRLVAENRAKLEKQQRWNSDAVRRAHDILEDG